MKILVLRGGALGDFLLTLPAVAGLREKWPDAEIEMVTARRHGELVVGPRAVQAVRPMETTGLASFYAKRGNLDSEWADYFTEFDLTVSYLFDPDEIFSENWKRAGGTGEYVRHDPRNPRVAAWRHLAEPLKRWGVEPGDARRLWGEKLSLLQSTERELASWVIHPGSGGASKCWALDGWLKELGKLAQGRPFSVTWLGGEAENDWDKQIPELWRTGKNRYVQNHALPEVFGILQAADLYLGHDSGISHLAGWSGVKCGLLFGPTDPAIWSPPGERVRCWSQGGRWPREGEWADWVERLVAD